MWFKHRAWIPIAWLLCLGNLAATWFAAQPGEAWHATTHALLALLFGLGAQWLNARQRAFGNVGAGADLPADVALLRQDLTALREAQSEAMKQIEQAVDAVAIEVERVGENQRFLTKALGQPGLSEGGASAALPEAAPVPRRSSRDE